MGETEQPDNSAKEIGAVTKHGQATIPRRFREKFGIEAPEKVRFRETEAGDVIVEHVRSPTRCVASPRAATQQPHVGLRDAPREPRPRP